MLRTNVVRADFKKPTPASKLSQKVVALHWNLAVRRAKQDLMPTEIACPFKSTPLVLGVSMLAAPPATSTPRVKHVVHINC